LRGDPLRLEQVLINLCGDAVKFTAHGEVAVRVESLPAPRSDAVVLRFTVRDTGVGIGSAQIGRLFRPFTQVDASTTRQFGGSGLGLAICKQLVEMMEGTIGVQSQPGVGSEFWFTATFGRVDAVEPDHDLPPVQANPATAPSEAPLVLRGRSVLLVEDNELNQLVATELLESVAGMSVALARNGSDALRMAREHRYAAILMDVQMPVMDGYEATRAIRGQPTTGTVPIIGMTANALTGDRQLCLTAGMNDYITKPFEPAELFAVLARWIGPDSAGSLQPPVQPQDGTGGVDFEDGLHRCLGRQELYLRIAERFVASRSEDADDLRDALARRDLGRARELAHTLTSTAGAIGALRLSRLARALERGILESTGETALKSIGEALAHEHHRVLHELTAYCNLHAERSRG
jgi:CheY-like chemotaxis protein